MKIAIDSPAAAGAGTLANLYQNIIIFFIWTQEKFIDSLHL